MATSTAENLHSKHVLPFTDSHSSLRASAATAFLPGICGACAVGTLHCSTQVISVNPYNVLTARVLKSEQIDNASVFRRLSTFGRWADAVRPPASIIIDHRIRDKQTKNARRQKIFVLAAIPSMLDDVVRNRLTRFASVLKMNMLTITLT